MALERLAFGLALRLTAGQVLLRGCVDAGLGDSDSVQGEVELAIALVVEAVALLLARGGVEGRDPASMASFASEAKRSTPATSAISLAAVSGPAARQREQLRRLTADERRELALKRVRLAGQLPATA